MTISDSQNGLNPNARYNTGPNAAGCGRCSTQAVMNEFGHLNGLMTDGHLAWTNLVVGPNVAGALRTNSGGNVAGAPLAQPVVVELV